MSVEEKSAWFHGRVLWARILAREYVKLAAQFGLPAEEESFKALSKEMHAKGGAFPLALAHQPELLVLGQPTSASTLWCGREFLESMVDRASQGQTVFLSSHQIAEVERVADIRGAFSARGRLQLVEPLDELKAQVQRLDSR